MDTSKFPESFFHRLIPALIVLMSISFALPVARADVVELMSGDRVEGKFKQATVIGVVIVVGGQTMTFPLDKVRAIYFGTAPAATPKSAQSSLFASALDALRSLRSAVGAGATFTQYMARLQDTKIQVDRYLTTASADSNSQKSQIARAMQLYAFAGTAWDIKNQDYTIEAYASLATNPLVATCANFKDFWKNPPKEEVGKVMWDAAKNDDPKNYTKGFLIAHFGVGEIWKCASKAVEEAERLQK
jgi:hypothetical protein